MSLDTTETVPEQPKTMDQILEMDHSDWTKEKIRGVMDCGIPGSARLWLRTGVMATATVTLFLWHDRPLQVEGAIASYEWHLTWQEDTSFPLHAVGRGLTGEMAYQNLLASLA